MGQRLLDKVSSVLEMKSDAEFVEFRDLGQQHSSVLSCLRHAKHTNLRVCPLLMAVSIGKQLSSLHLVPNVPFDVTRS